MTAVNFGQNRAFPDSDGTLGQAVGSEWTADKECPGSFKQWMHLSWAWRCCILVVGVGLERFVSGWNSAAVISRCTPCYQHGISSLSCQFDQ